MAFVPQPHAFNRRVRCIPWVICSRCGLIKLNNPFTDWCARTGCNHDEHPEYQKQRDKATAV